MTPIERRDYANKSTAKLFTSAPILGLLGGYAAALILVIEVMEQGDWHGQVDTSSPTIPVLGLVTIV